MVGESGLCSCRACFRHRAEQQQGQTEGRPTISAEDQRQVLPVVGRGGVEEQSGALAGPEAQGHLLPPQGQGGERGGGQGALVPTRVPGLSEGVAHRGGRREAGRQLWRTCQRVTLLFDYYYCTAA